MQMHIHIQVHIHTRAHAHACLQLVLAMCTFGVEACMQEHQLRAIQALLGQSSFKAAAEALFFPSNAYTCGIIARVFPLTAVAI